MITHLKNIFVLTFKVSALVLALMWAFILLALSACGTAQSYDVTPNEHIPFYAQSERALKLAGDGNIIDQELAIVERLVGLEPGAIGERANLEIEFTDAEIPCQSDGFSWCYGLTTHADDHTTTQVYADSDQLGCTSLGHELLHVALRVKTGDGDPHHTSIHWNYMNALPLCKFLGSK